MTNGTIDYLDYRSTSLRSRRADLPPQARDGRLRPEALRQRGAQGLGHRHHAHGCWRAGIMTGRVATTAAQDRYRRAAPRQLPGHARPRALDSKGANHGAYVNGVTRGVAGALPSDSDTAVRSTASTTTSRCQPDGHPGRLGLRSVEAWFKTTSAAPQVLFGYGSRANPGVRPVARHRRRRDDRLGLRRRKRQVVHPVVAVNNGAWHQVVMTYDGTSIVLYVDGVALTAQTATRNTVMDSYGFGIGAIITPATPTPVGSSTARSTRSRSTPRVLDRRRSPPTTSSAPVTVPEPGSPPRSPTWPTPRTAPPPLDTG